MSISNNELLDREHLHMLQQFTLNRESEEIRDELYEYMIMSMIYRHSTNGKLEEYKIHKLMGQDFHLSKMPAMQVKDGISRLKSKNFIHEENSSVTLSKKKIQKFKKTSEEVISLEKKVLDELKTEISKKFPKELESKIPLLVDAFDEVLEMIFKKFGFQAAQIFADMESKLEDLSDFTTFSDLYNEKVLKDLPKEYQKELDKILHDFFENPTEERGKYFFSVAQSYVLTQILNIEPNLKKIQIDSLSKKRVYLDTNILINLLFGGSSSAESIIELINHTSNLKIKLKINQKTSLELKKWLENKKNKYKNFKLPSTKLATALDGFDNTDPFFTVYSKSLQNDSNLNVNKFCKKYDEFEIMLSNKFGITIDKTDKSLEKHPKFQNLKSKIIETANRTKHDDVAVHDAYSILRVRQLRASKKGDEIGPSVWFLTTDFTLTPAEKQIFDINDISANITIDAWFQIISTFISPIGEIQKTSIAFTKFLSSHFDSHKLNVNDYLNLVDALTDDADFTLEQLKKITGDNFIKQKLQTINQKREVGEPPSQSEIQKAVAEMQKLTKGDFEEQVKKIQKESEQELSKFKDRTTDAEDKVKKITIRSSLIILTLSLAFLNIIFDLTIFQSAFLEMNSNVVPILALNFAMVLGIPKLVHFLYKPS